MCPRGMVLSSTCDCSGCPSALSWFLWGSCVFVCPALRWPPILKAIFSVVKAALNSFTHNPCLALPSTRLPPHFALPTLVPCSQLPQVNIFVTPDTISFVRVLARISRDWRTKSLHCTNLASCIRILAIPGHLGK